MTDNEQGLWPVPNSYVRSVPHRGLAGAFREDRIDRRHCGVDIYAPAGSSVLAMGPGTVVATGIATSPRIRHYWDVTYHVTVAHASGRVARYAELADVMVGEGEDVAAGDVLGHVGRVIDPTKVTDDDPAYVQRLSVTSPSMLHIELHDRYIDLERERRYSGGNWFTGTLPGVFIDPTPLLRHLASTSMR